MLSPPDAEFVRREARVPGLAHLLDLDRAGELIQAALGQKIDGCTIDYLRYKPAANCLVSYRVCIAGADVLVYALAHGPDAPEKLAKARRHLQKTGQEVAGQVDEENGIVFYRFPTDRHMERLPELVADDEGRRAFLRRLLPERPQFWQARVTPLHYKPERRFVARLEGRADQALLKLYTDKGYAQAAAASAAFYPAPGLYIPQRWGRSSRRLALVWEWVDGYPLVDVLDRDPSQTQVLLRVGEALARFHCQRPARISTHRSGLAVLKTAVNAVAALVPSLEDQARELATHMQALVVTHPANLTPIHGDFSIDQILLPKEIDGVAILDLDHAAWGDPADDFASFAAELAQRTLNALPAALAPDTALEALYRGYSRRRRPPALARIHCYVAMHLLRRAPEAFRLRLTQDWPGQMEQMLTLAEQEISRAQTLSA